MYFRRTGWTFKSPEMQYLGFYNCYIILINILIADGKFLIEY